MILKPPYTTEGKMTFRVKDYRGKSGVYIIRDIVTKEVLYIGKGNCVQRQLYSHFQNWIKRDIIINGRAYKNIFIDRDSAEVFIFLHPKEGLTAVEDSFIAKYNPTLNRRKTLSYTHDVENFVYNLNKDSHLDWDKINKLWQDYIDTYGHEPF